MESRSTILTPVARLVQGSLYTPSTKSKDGKPLVNKSGEPRVEFYFAVAILKTGENHWRETEWGAKIWAVGQQDFPAGQANSPTFAWKINDGDSTLVNRENRRWCDYEGYPGCWVLNFKAGFAPVVCNENGTQIITEKDHVNLGDFVQVFGTVKGNSSTQQPGVYLNPSDVAFSRFGQRIFKRPDPSKIGFGNSPIPEGASLTPPAAGFNPGATASAPPASASHVPPAHPAILTPPAPVGAPPAAPVRVMTSKAAGIPYESFIKEKWTDASLIQEGYMQPY